MVNRLAQLCHATKTHLFILFPLAIALLIDSSFIRFYSFNSITQYFVDARFPIFFVTATVCIIGQYFTLILVKNVSKQVRENRHIHMQIIHRTVFVVQVATTALFIILIGEMANTSSYSSNLVVIMVSISYSLSAGLMGMLAYRFFMWFRSVKDISIFLYCVAAISICMNSSFTGCFVISVLIDVPNQIASHSGMSFAPYIAPGSTTAFLNLFFIISSVISFILMWSATITLWKRSPHGWGMVKYLSILGFPLAYFLIQFFPLFPNLMTSLFPGSSSVSIFFIYTVLFTFSKPVGGALFGLAFWQIARRLKAGTDLKQYMIFSGYGLVLLFLSNQAIVLVYLPYPPSGLPSVLYQGLASYLIYIGIYSSAVSISQDTKLRRSIRESAVRLFDSIGSAHMENEIISNIATLTEKLKDDLAERSGIEPSLDEDSVADYTKQVLEVINKEREAKLRSDQDGVK